MSKRRLIDADALRKAFDDKCVEECACCKESSGPTVIVARVKCKTHDHCGLLDAAPTIDAIPMEWLREKMRGYASALKSTELKALVTVMQMWQKEQEAKE